MEFKIRKEELEGKSAPSKATFPKYTTQLINCANQTAQGTRPRVVGQMSQLLPQYRREAEEPSVEGWRQWYRQQYPHAVDTATEKICHQIENLREALEEITPELVRSWVEDLVVEKTYAGLSYQQSILAALSKEKGKPWRLATPEEEAKGVDGFVGKKAYSIKPKSYKTMDRLPETIDTTMIYYQVSKGGDLKVEVEE